MFGGSYFFAFFFCVFHLCTFACAYPCVPYDQCLFSCADAGTIPVIRLLKKEELTSQRVDNNAHTSHQNCSSQRKQEKMRVNIQWQIPPEVFFFEKCSQAVTWVFFSNCDLFLSSGETGTATTKEEPNKLCFLSVIRYIPLKLILFFSSLLSSKQNGIPSSHLDFFFFFRNKNKFKANLLFPPLFFNLLFNTLSCNTHSLLFFSS